MNNFILHADDIHPELPDEMQEQFDAQHKLYVSLFNKVNGIAPSIESDTPHTLETICGYKYWNLLSLGEQEYAGKCMNDLVETGFVPFRKVESNHEYPPMYERI